MVEIAYSSYPEIYLKIESYRKDLEAPGIHNDAVKKINNSMVEEIAIRICNRLSVYNNILQKCCDHNSVANFARYLKKRRELTECFSVYSEFFTYNFENISSELTEIVFQSLLWVQRYKNHPRLCEIESPPSDGKFKNYV